MIDIDFNKYEVIFAPETIEEEVVQNIRNIINEMFFGVPYHREFGLNPTYLDGPIQMTQMKMRVDITNQVNRFEPRAKIIDIKFNGEAVNGYTMPTVRIALND